jgi:hypothetical protein
VAIEAKVIYYKTLSMHGKPCHGGADAGYTLGQWTDPRDPIPCASGYHLCEERDLLEWLAPRVFIAEARGRIVMSNLKVTVEQARLIRELPFGAAAALAFGEWCLRRVGLPRPADAAGEVARANLANEQGELALALGWMALEAGPETAAQVAPKRAAQAAAWLASQAAIEAAWAQSDGEAPIEFWEEAEEQAAYAKVEAHQAERCTQHTELMRRLNGGTL